MPEGGRIERWVQVLSEQLGCACRKSDEIARMIQEAVDERRRRGAGRETWLSPYVDCWRETYGGEPPCGVLAKHAKLVETAADSPAVALRSFARYIGQTEAAYVSLPKWSATWRSWLPQVRM